MKIYVEGGGDSKELKIRCRQGFRKLLEKADLPRMPGTVAGGGRDSTFEKFKTAVSQGRKAILLVDSEDPVTASSAWAHLKARDNWDQPAGTDDEQAQLMVTCMETWIVADQPALHGFFGQCLNENALPPLNKLESRTRQDVQGALHHATKGCGQAKMYTKGSRSFQLLAALNPQTLKQHLPHFQGLIDTLGHRL